MLTFIYILSEAGGGGENPLQLATQKRTIVKGLLCGRQRLLRWGCKAGKRFPSTARPDLPSLQHSQAGETAQPQRCHRDTKPADLTSTCWKKTSSCRLCMHMHMHTRSAKLELRALTAYPGHRCHPPQSIWNFGWTKPEENVSSKANK